MSDLDAYGYEMARIWLLSDEDVDRVLAGERAGDETLDTLAGLLGDAQVHFGGPGSDGRRAQDLTLMALEASQLGDGMNEPSDVRTPKSWREILDRTRSIALKGAAAVAAASLSMFGLAFAVDLPEQASETAREKAAAAERSNQGGGDEVEVTQGGKSVADDVNAFIESTDLTGCEFGQGVAEIASQNAQAETGPAEDPCTKSDDTEGEGTTTTDEEKSAPGLAKAAEARGTDEDEETDTDDTEEAEDAEDDAEENGGGGSETASEKSGGASDHGSAGKP